MALCPLKQCSCGARDTQWWSLLVDIPRIPGREANERWTVSWSHSYYCNPWPRHSCIYQTRLALRDFQCLLCWTTACHRSSHYFKLCRLISAFQKGPWVTYRELSAEEDNYKANLHLWKYAVTVTYLQYFVLWITVGSAKKRKKYRTRLDFTCTNGQRRHCYFKGLYKERKGLALWSQS